MGQGKPIEPPSPPSLRIGLLLAADQAAGLLSGLWADWDGMRILSCAVYLWIGFTVARV